MQQRARAVIWLLYKDDTDLEKPRMKKRRLCGKIQLPNGKIRIFKPKYIEIKKPDKELLKMVEEEDYKAKSLIIQNKLKQLFNQMKIEIGDIDKKLVAIVKHSVENPESISLIAKRTVHGWKLKKEASVMYELDVKEIKRLEFMLNDELRKQDYMKAKELVEDATEHTPTN